MLIFKETNRKLVMIVKEDDYLLHCFCRFESAHRRPWPLLTFFCCCATTKCQKLIIYFSWNLFHSLRDYWKLTKKLLSSSSSRSEKRIISAVGTANVCLALKAFTNNTVNVYVFDLYLWETSWRWLTECSVNYLFWRLRLLWTFKDFTANAESLLIDFEHLLCFRRKILNNLLDLILSQLNLALFDSVFRDDLN